MGMEKNYWGTEALGNRIRAGTFPTGFHSTLKKYFPSGQGDIQLTIQPVAQQDLPETRILQHNHQIHIPTSASFLVNTSSIPLQLLNLKKRFIDNSLPPFPHSSSTSTKIVSRVDDPNYLLM